MKALKYCAVLLLISSAAALESYIPVLKDGWASAEANQGKSKYLRVANGTKSWLTFATGSYDLSKAVSAYLAIYIDGIETKGKLIVQGLKDAPATLESITGLDNITAEETITDREISDENLESIVLLNITDAVKKEGFKGVILSSENLELTLSSKEGAFKPFILLKKEVKQFSIEEKSIITSQLADNAVTKEKIEDASVTSAKIANSTIQTEDIRDSAITSEKILSLDYDKISNKPSIASGDHKHPISDVDSLNNELDAHKTLLSENATGISDNKTNISSLTDKVAANETSIGTHAGRITTLENTDSYPPTGDAGGALSGEYPNPSLKSNAVTSENIKNGTIVEEDISTKTWEKKSDHGHNHSGQTLEIAGIQIGGTNAPQMATIMWEATTAGGSSTSISLGSSNYKECPKPDGMISLYGLLFNGKEMVPTGFGTGTNNEWHVKYVKGTPGLVSDKLIIETPGSNTLKKKIRIFCIYQP